VSLIDDMQRAQIRYQVLAGQRGRSRRSLNLWVIRSLLAVLAALIAGVVSYRLRK
jgi:hypothetical protein